MSRVDSAGQCLAPQKLRCVLVQIAVDERQHRADAGFAVSEILRRAKNSVLSSRLDHGRTNHFAACDGEQAAHRRPARQSAGELGCTKDRGGGGNIGLGIADQPRQLRRPPNPTRVEHPRRITVEAENATAFEKEGPLLGEKGLERGEIQLRRIGFHLAEVRVHGCVESQVRRDAVFQIAADRLLLGPREPVRLRYARILGHHIGRRLESVRRAEPAQSGQVAKL